jgi:hypothetical protein
MQTFGTNQAFKVCPAIARGAKGSLYLMGDADPAYNRWFLLGPKAVLSGMYKPWAASQRGRQVASQHAGPGLHQPLILLVGCHDECKVFFLRVHRAGCQLVPVSSP